MFACLIRRNSRRLRISEIAISPFSEDSSVALALGTSPLTLSILTLICSESLPHNDMPWVTPDLRNL
jgi:hypothetical protein